jgi:hypothetical protein
MARFFKAKLHNVEIASGTTDGPPVDANDLVDSTASFLTGVPAVSVGDYVVSGGVVYVVADVPAETSLTFVSGTVADVTAYEVFSATEYTERMFSTENIIYTVRTDEYNTDLVYKHEAAANLLTFTHPSDATSEYVVDTLNNLLSDVHSGKTYPNVVSSFVPEVVLVKGVLST